MKLTPLDIHHKEFRHSLRGYSEEEVDAFLDEVADEFERLFKENIDLAEKLEAANDKLRDHELMEKTVHNTLVAAQKSAEDIEANALKEAELTRKDAELRAKEIIHEALTLKQKTQNEFMRIKDGETQFRQAFRNMLEDHLGRIQEIPVPADIAALSGTDEVAEDIVASMESVQTVPAVPPAPEPMIAVEPQPAAVVMDLDETADEFEESSVQDAFEDAPDILPDELLEPEPAPALLIADEGDDEVELPASGFVTAVQLGEVEDTDLAAETPEYEDEPVTFEIPSLDSLGERDDDMDIEEID